MGSGFENLALAETLASHLFDLTTEISSKYGLFKFSIYPIFFLNIWVKLHLHDELLLPVLAQLFGNQKDHKNKS
jgi:hypothetical protein